jgi:hypothetical protein
MNPPFYFGIAPMAPAGHGAPRRSRTGRWLPPQTLGSNLQFQALYFSYDGQSTRVVSRFPGNLRLYKCHSLYHDYAYIWTVPFDASTQVVGTGLNTSATRGPNNDEQDSESDSSSNSNSDSEDEEQRPNIASRDWQPLSFRHLSERRSYVGRQMPEGHLAVSRDDQIWPEQLFPDTYSAQEETEDEDEGGLLGELTLLIGLLAFTVPEANVATLLPACMGENWDVYPPQQLRRSIGCKI